MDDVADLKNVTILKPFGIAYLTASSALKRFRNSKLWLHALRLESAVTSTITQFRFKLIADPWVRKCIIR